MPKGLKTLGFSFQDATLTHFGGLVLIERFCQKLRLRYRLQHAVRVPQRAGEFAPCDLVLALLYVLIAGLRRVSKTQILQYNGTFLACVGLDRFPDPSSLRRFLQRLSPPAIRQLVRLHDRLRAQLAPRRRSTLVFDLDAVVVTVYGQQQGRGSATIPRRRAAAPIIRCCASKPIGTSSGMARCDRATRRPTRGQCILSGVVWPRCRPRWRGGVCVCGPTRASLAESCWGCWNNGAAGM